MADAADSTPVRRRQVLCLGALGALACAIAPPVRAADSVALPPVNLRLEVRQTTEMGSEGRQFRSTRQGTDAQALLILNGARALLRVSETRVIQWYQVGRDSRGGWTVQPSALVVDAGRGVVLQPRWPGGQQPVTLEITAESTRMAPGGGAAVAATEGALAMTTVQVPLGEWVTVAAALEQGQRSGGRTWSSGDASQEGRYAVQVRVTQAP